MGQERLNGLAILSIERANHASPLLCLKGVVRQVYCPLAVPSQLVGLDVQMLRLNYHIVSSHDQIETCPWTTAYILPSNHHYKSEYDKKYQRKLDSIHFIESFLIVSTVYVDKHLIFLIECYYFPHK